MQREVSYKVWSWGSPVGTSDRGRNQSFNVGVWTVAKRSTANQFEVANELICARLGTALGLPIPPWAILTRPSNGLPYFASLHPAVSGEKLPPINPNDRERILADEWLTCGIIAFDSWIFNEDRWFGNLRYDEQSGPILIDHGSAFYDRSGRAYFERHANHTCLRHHCLAEQVVGLDDFDEWHERIRQLPVYFIRESIERAVHFGLPEEDVDFCVSVLLDRRNRLKDIFRDGLRVAFPNLDQDLLSPFSSNAEQELIEEYAADWCI